MLRIYALALAMVVNCGFAVSASAQWTEQVSPTIQPLNDVFLWDANFGWATGDQGMLRTTSGGAPWALLEMSGNILGVHFINATEGWGCGNGGVIEHTVNGGAAWTPQTSGTTLKLRDIWFSDCQQGWAVGRDAVILHTADGGTTWATQSSPAVTELNAIVMLNHQLGWSSGSDGRIIHTADGGINWDSQLSVPLGNNDGFHALYAVDANNVWAAGGQGRIFHTTNGGLNWLPQSSGTTETIEDIVFNDLLSGWICGSNGLLRNTADGGASWIAQTPPAVLTFNALDFVNSGLATMVSAVGRIFRYQAPLTNPDQLVVHPVGNDAQLHWLPATGATGYNIYRGDVPEFALDPAHLVGSSPLPGFNDIGAFGSPAATQFYVVTATN